MKVHHFDYDFRFVYYLGFEIEGKLNSWRNCVVVDHMTVVFGDVAGMLGDTGFNRIKVCYKGMGERGVIDKLRG